MIGIRKEMTRVAGGGDPHWANVAFLLKNSGINGANNNTFLDSGPNNFAITRNGNVTQGTFGPAVGVSSGYWDGNGDYLSIPSHSAFNLGTGDFAIENYICLPVVPTGDVFFISASGSGGMFFGFRGSAGNVIGIGRAGIAWDTQWNTALVPNTLYHIALTRSAGTIRLFVNGVLQGSAVSNSTAYNLGATSLNIGSQGANFYYTGYQALVRISNIPRYTANFTPSTTYASDANTVLFLRFNNAGIYDATRKNVIETVSNVSVSTAVQLFGQSSVTYDGSGDYWRVPNRSEFNIGTGAVTLDGWFRTPSVPNNYKRICQLSNPSTILTEVLAIEWNNNNTLSGVVKSAGTYYAATTVSAFNADTWYYYSLVRNGTALTLYTAPLGGSGSVASTTLPANLSIDYSSALEFLSGKWHTGDTSRDWNGQVAEIRLTPGIARPNTVPTAPFPTS